MARSLPTSYNLSHGFDKFDLQSLTFSHTFASPSSPENNVPLPVIQLKDGKLLFGTSIGQIKICDVSDQMTQTLAVPGT